jgi:hypothetical protein
MDNPTGTIINKKASAPGFIELISGALAGNIGSGHLEIFNKGKPLQNHSFYNLGLNLFGVVSSSANRIAIPPITVLVPNPNFILASQIFQFLIVIPRGPPMGLPLLQ